jgi:hypothetical protein
VTVCVTVVEGLDVLTGAVVVAACGRTPNRCDASGRKAANGPLNVTVAMPTSPPAAAAATMIRPPWASDLDGLVDRVTSKD